MKFSGGLIYKECDIAPDGESLALQLSDQAGQAFWLEMDQTMETESYICIFDEDRNILSAEEKTNLWPKLEKIVNVPQDALARSITADFIEVMKKRM
jgi:hypothetical protein